MKKSLFREIFLLYSNCIHYTCKKGFLFKIPLMLLKTLKNTSFMISFRKKVYCGYIQCFFVIVWWKKWNKQKILKKLTFSVKRNFFREIPYIPFFWTKKKMVFLRKDVNSSRNAGNGIIYAILRKKKNCHEKLIYFFKKKDFSVFFPFISMFWMKMMENARK